MGGFVPNHQIYSLWESSGHKAQHFPVKMRTGILIVFKKTFPPAPAMDLSTFTAFTRRRSIEGCAAGPRYSKTCA